MTDATPITPLPYESDVPDLDIDEVRKDYFDIWQKNVVVVEQWRATNTEAGNYGEENETQEWTLNKEIRLNIQGQGSNAYSREKYGIDNSSKSWHSYALHDEDLKPQDRIIWNNTRFIIVNLNQGTYGGERVFWEFDLKSIDTDDSTFYEAK